MSRECSDHNSGIRKAGGIFLLMLIILLMGIIFADFNEITALAASSAAEQRTKDVEEIVQYFFESRTAERIDDIQDMIGDDRDSFYTQFWTWQICGLESYDDVRVYAYPLKESDHWIAAIVYNATMEGIDIPLPGVETVVVQRQADDNWLIFTDSLYIDSSLQEEIYQVINGNKEILELVNEANMEFNSILTKHPEFLEWLQETSNKQSKIMGEILSGDYDWEKLREEAQKEPQDEFYEVQKGDCLWHIAETELGDGALWTELYEANRETIGADPNRILIGMLLQLP